MLKLVAERLGRASQKKAGVYALLLLVAAILGVLLFKVAEIAFSKDAGLLVSLLVVGIFLILGIAAYLQLPKKIRNMGHSELSITQVIFIGGGLILVLSVAPDILGMFDPTPATQVDVRREGQKTRDEVGRLMTLPKDMVRTSQKMNGFWGETGCPVIWEVKLHKAALVVDAVRRPKGTAPWRLVGTIVAQKSDEVTIIAEQPKQAKGSGATFIIESNGINDHLIWDDKSGAIPRRLDRCSP
jgi:hypothetical protein